MGAMSVWHWLILCQASKLLDTLSSKLMNTFVSVCPLRGEGKNCNKKFIYRLFLGL